MKKILLHNALTALFISLTLCAKAQQEIKVETFFLDNGMKVVLAEEHSKPEIYGSVLVHAGSKDEDTNATGVAHYLEHIMFKGTDRIGTIDWASEKPLLDSISDLYDQMQQTADPEQRHQIQLEINRLNIAASKYAIPNETDAILQKMGCTGLNAGTSWDQTIYYNTLPSNQLENWMEVYAERFRAPVFRLFQGELEAVYEEKNLRSNSNPVNAFVEGMLTEAFGNHPYSRPIIGHTRHLKNPQPSEMYKFYNRWYVANNLTLILVGDFKTSEAKQLAKKYFSSLPSGQLPEKKNYELPKFEKQVVKNVRQTPLKMGVMIFPGVNNSHPDHVALEMMSEILSGERFTDAMTEHKLLAAMYSPFAFNEAGANVIIYAPKIVGQSHAKAEEVVWQCLDSIKAGLFSDTLLRSIKMEAALSNKRLVESAAGINSLLQGLEAAGQSYDDWIAENIKRQEMSREDIIAVAKKYFDRNHVTIIRSKMGFPKPEEAVKPDWEHLESQNQDAHTDFAKHIEENTPTPIKPQVIDFNHDVAITPVTSQTRLYSVKNPKNDLFELDIVYNYGTMDDPELDRAANYLQMLGTGDMNLTKYMTAMRLLGGECYLNVGTYVTTLQISGPEDNMEAIVDLALARLRNPRHDKSQIDLIVKNSKGDKKAAKNDVSSWSNALQDFVIYGDKSDYLNHMPIKKWGKMSGEQMASEIDSIYTRNGYVVFVGNNEPDKIVKMLRDKNLVREGVKIVPPRALHREQPYEATVWYADNNKFVEAYINYIFPSSNFDTVDEASALLFNEYFGGGMNSVVFQEIREFRSLGYHTSGYFNYDRRNLNRSYMRCFLAAQSDKTIDGLEAMQSIVQDLPLRQDKFDAAKQGLITTRNGNYLSFRSIPSTVGYWMEERGLSADPRQAVTAKIHSLSMDDMAAFHTKYIKDRPMSIMLCAKMKNVDMEKLKTFGKLKEVKFDQMFKF
ncbi:MAG: insulinase family protein [Bacteroidales bacterium]|nr:insulinase family protein [Bacteroidales bacterium]